MTDFDVSPRHSCPVQHHDVSANLNNRLYLVHDQHDSGARNEVNLGATILSVVIANTRGFGQTFSIRPSEGATSTDRFGQIVLSLLVVWNDFREI
jgi:hypothetical protein